MKGVVLDFSRPGKPTDNAFAEAFAEEAAQDGRPRAAATMDDLRKPTFRGFVDQTLGANCRQVCGTRDDVAVIARQDDDLAAFNHDWPVIADLQLRFPEGAAWLDAFKAEILAFPFGQHDDQVDALSQLLSWIAKDEYTGTVATFVGYAYIEGVGWVSPSGYNWTGARISKP